MKSTISIDDYDRTRPLGLPLSADVQGIVRSVVSATLLRVPHESLVADVAAWLVAEAEHRASWPWLTDISNPAENGVSRERDRAGDLVDGMRARELRAICSTLASGYSLDPELPLGVYARVEAEPWLVDSAASLKLYVEGLTKVSLRGRKDEGIDFVLDVRAEPRLYVSDLLRAHAAYAGRYITATVVSRACLQALAAARRVMEAR